MSRQPLAEVFGYPITNVSIEANRYRNNALCRFGNVVPNCTKDKAEHPLGVCSIFHGREAVITCPVRFREHWLIAEDAAAFFFPKDTRWTTLKEVRLRDGHGKSAGSIDIVLCSYDEAGRVTDFGALEVQAVYISGNIRRPFEHYLAAPPEQTAMDWSKQPHYPKPDYLSSSRKRLAPQLIYKGGILHTWRKKTAVALHRGFYDTLPTMQAVAPEEADIAWFVYQLEHDEPSDTFCLRRDKQVYTRFSDSMDAITRSVPGSMQDFIEVLQGKVDAKLERGHPPDTEVTDAPF